MARSQSLDLFLLFVLLVFASIPIFSTNVNSKEGLRLSGPNLNSITSSPQVNGILNSSSIDNNQPIKQLLASGRANNLVKTEINNDTFISEWNSKLTSFGSSSKLQVRLPLVSTGTYNFTVDWGDSTNSTITIWDQLEVMHTYELEGIYTLSINGLLEGWSFDNGGDKLKILEISQWGNISLGNSDSYFYGCYNLLLTANDSLNLNGTTTLYQAFMDNINLGNSGNMNYWDVSSVTNMTGMFNGASSFNQPIGNWDVSSVTDMNGMFFRASSFNQPIGNWDVSRVSNMGFMFGSNFLESSGGVSPFNQLIGDWNVSSVTSMVRMFFKASSFNQPIGDWNVSNVTDMGEMFLDASSFNHPIGNWDVSSIVTMVRMFSGASSFNQPIGNWDVSSVTDMNSMFFRASSFNQSISYWDVSRVADMSFMFSYASYFNQFIGDWDVSLVTNMRRMFWEASSFNQPIGKWDVSRVTDMASMFREVTLSSANYDNLLEGWASLSLQNMVKFDAGNSFYTNTAAKQHIIDTFDWRITDLGLVPGFETTQNSSSTKITTSLSTPGLYPFSSVLISLAIISIILWKSKRQNR